MKHILFDLDGTLTDPGVGITRAAAVALESYGIHVSDLKELYPFIGPPLADSFRRFYGFSPARAAEAVSRFRAYYREKGILENEVYPGMASFLARLKDAGCRLYVATSKPEDFSHRVLSRFDLEGYFTDVVGSTYDGSRDTKSAVIACLLQRYPSIADGTALMVGDRKHDVEGAHANGLPAAGVLYGYGSRAEMEACGADYIVGDLPELERLIVRELP